MLFIFSRMNTILSDYFQYLVIELKKLFNEHVLESILLNSILERP